MLRVPKTRIMQSFATRRSGPHPYTPRFDHLNRLHTDRTVQSSAPSVQCNARIKSPPPAARPKFIPAHTQIELRVSASSRQAHQDSAKRPRHDGGHNALRAGGQPDRHLQCRSHAPSAVRHAAILTTAQKQNTSEYAVLEHRMHARTRPRPASQHHDCSVTGNKRGPCDDRARMRSLSRTCPAVHLAAGS